MSTFFSPTPPVMVVFKLLICSAVDGKDLLELDDNELEQELHLTGLQIRKIRNGLAERGIAQPPPSSKASSQVAPAPTIGVPATAIPAGPSVPIKDRFSAADLDAYRSVQAVIQSMETEGLEGKLAGAQQAANATYTALQKTRREIEAAKKQVETADKEVEHKGGWYPGKILFGKAKAHEKLDSAEKALKDATDKLSGLNQKAASLEKTLVEDKRNADQLQARLNELNGHRSQRSALVNSMFEQPQWTADPTLSSLRGTLAELRRQAAENSGHATTYGRAGDLLKSAMSKINEALQGLQRYFLFIFCTSSLPMLLFRVFFCSTCRTQFMGGMEMGMDMVSPYRRPGGSMMMDMAQMAIVQRANQSVQMAARDIMQARQVLPSLPPMSEALLKEAQMGVFASVLMPGMGGNMLQMAMVRKSIQNVQKLAHETTECLDWTKSNLIQFTTLASQLRAQSVAKETEVDTFQKEALAVALS